MQKIAKTLSTTLDANKKDMVDGCVRQLSVVKTYYKLSEEELKNIFL